MWRQSLTDDVSVSDGVRVCVAAVTGDVNVSDDVSRQCSEAAGLISHVAAVAEPI